MPEVFWKEVEDIQHEIKGTLTKTAGIEVTCKRCSGEVKRYCDEIRKEVQEELDRLNEIILRQVNGDK